MDHKNLLDALPLKMAEQESHLQDNSGEKSIPREQPNQSKE